MKPFSSTNRRRKLIPLALSALLLAGCRKAADIPEFSDAYLVSTAWGGMSWGEYYDCISARVIICCNHDLLVYMPALGDAPAHPAESELIATLTLTDAQYAAMESALDRNQLYTLDPKEDKEVCDGCYQTLTLYGADDRAVKICGGYMPQSDRFCEMYRAVQDNLPADVLNKIRTERIEALREAAESGEQENTE